MIKIECLRGNVGDAAAGRAAQTMKITTVSRNRSGQVAAEIALVRALILAAELLQGGGHSIVLVPRAREAVREAPRDARRDLGALARRAAHASHIGTCETVAMW